MSIKWGGGMLYCGSLAGFYGGLNAEHLELLKHDVDEKLMSGTPGDASKTGVLGCCSRAALLQQQKDFAGRWPFEEVLKRLRTVAADSLLPPMYQNGNLLLTGEFDKRTFALYDRGDQRLHIGLNDVHNLAPNQLDQWITLFCQSLTVALDLDGT
jgi:hypothetical protein